MPSMRARPPINYSSSLEMATKLMLLLLLFVHCYADIAEYDDPERIAEEQGYMKREHSLGRPFQGRGTEVF